METHNGDYEFFLNLAQYHAETHSGCCKVTVGSILVDNIERPNLHIEGANRTLPVSCRKNGCLRVEKYGNNDKTHRNPDDCRAIHSEIDAISYAARSGISTEGMTIFVTRYPCEACARAIVAAGIKTVVYGRKQEIPDTSLGILNSAGIEVIHYSRWDKEDVIT